MKSFMPLLVALLTSLSLLPAASAQAGPSTAEAAPSQTTQAEEAHRPWLINVNIASLGAPAGAFAVELEVDLVDGLTVSLGGGRDVHRNTQAASMLRALKERGPVQIGLGAGVSFGDFTESRLFGSLTTSYDDGEYTHSSALWGNAEALIGLQASNGLQTRLFLGLSRELSYDRCINCEGDYDEDAAELNWGPYLGWSVGYAF